MNANDQIIYKHKPCVVLDAKLEGYSLEDDQVLLQEESSQFIGAGPMRHLVHCQDIALEPAGMELHHDPR
jgi:hypothetical protein